MELKGNIFFNVTLSFWTKANHSSSITRKAALSSSGSSVGASSTISYGNAIRDNSFASGNNETTESTISEASSRSALFKEDLVKLVLINEGNGNISIDDQSRRVNTAESVDIINRHINGRHLFDSAHLYRAGNQSDHSSIADSLAGLSSDLVASHYRDASLAHQQSLPLLTSITDASNTALTTSASVTPWNLTLASQSAANWTDMAHLNNAVSGHVQCLHNSLAQGCLLQSDNTSNLTALTSITSSEPFDLLDQHHRVYWALFLIVLPILALFGNILVILSVYRERSLQTVTNWFIVSLAFADLFVTIPMLFSLYVMVNVDWELSELICDLYIAIDVICSTASIFNLVAISFDRYIAVTHPIFYSKHKNDKRVIVTIILVWIASAGVGMPIMLGANTSPERTPELCIFYNSDFIIYSSLWSFYVPCLIMVILYYKIFKAIHDRARKKIDSTKSKANSNTASAGRNNAGPGNGLDRELVRNHIAGHENISPSKQLLAKSANHQAIKLEQMKVPCEVRNHTQTSVALICEINIANAENNNSNNTESHLEDDEEEDEEDLEEGDEIEIKQLNNRCSSQFNSDAACNCSIYANANNDKLNNANSDSDLVPPNVEICQHRSCQEARQDAVVAIEGEGVSVLGAGCGHLATATTMFIVENASTSLKLQHSSANNLSACQNGADQFNQHQTCSRDGASPSASTSLTVGGSCGEHRDRLTIRADGNNNGTSKRPSAEPINDNGSGALNESGLVASKYSKKKSRFNLGRKHKSSRKKREKASAKRERKATKTLAIVLGVFLLCWTPFFSCNILDAICIKLHENHFIQSDCRPGMTAFLLTTWLGYMNSCANPLIYTIFNPEFRKAFRKILCQL